MYQIHVHNTKHMKIILPHVVADIANVLKNPIVIYLNRNGNITECRGILYSGNNIQMVPLQYGNSIPLLPEDEIYYNS